MICGFHRLRCSFLPLFSSLLKATAELSLFVSASIEASNDTSGRDSVAIHAFLGSVFFFFFSSFPPLYDEETTKPVLFVFIGCGSELVDTQI